jgi:hypothetical protein
MPSIVTVNVSVLQAPTPNTLQQTGALISQGGTSAAANSLTLLTQLADLTAIVIPPHAITSLTWTTGVVTATTTAPHGFTTGDIIAITIQGAVPVGYNGTHQSTVTGASTFTYPLTTNPGTETTPGTYLIGSATEVLAMATTFFAQGNGQSVYVLELGEGTAAEGVTALTAYLTANPQTIYGFLVPRSWDNEASFLTLIASYESPTAMLYFWVTTTQATYSRYTAVMKCVIALIEAPGIPSNEFSIASGFYHALHYRPSSTNRVSPFCFAYVFGVTSYPSLGNNALLQQFKNAAINYIGNGAEGGVTQNIFLWGTTKDARDFTYWYSVDWTQINLNLDLTNEIINGANNPVNPLYYDQHGINRLEARAAGTMSRAITFGMAVGTVLQTEFDQPALQEALDSDAFSAQAVVNAVPFVPYATANPGDYKLGLYAGLTVIYIPQRGFTQLVVNLVVSDFVTF